VFIMAVAMPVSTRSHGRGRRANEGENAPPDPQLGSQANGSQA
jgi:hypothetical protein